MPQAALLLQDIEAINVLAPLVDAHKDFFAWLVEGSPFLARLIRRYPDTLTALSGTPPEEYLADLYAALQADMEQGKTATAPLPHCVMPAIAPLWPSLWPIWPICGMSKPSLITSRAWPTSPCAAAWIIYCARRQTTAV